jgi:hypothetical protein
VSCNGTAPRRPVVIPLMVCFSPKAACKCGSALRHRRPPFVSRHATW